MTVKKPADPDAMKGTHRWVILNWSKIRETSCLYTEEFVVGGFTWRIMVYPRGNSDPREHISVFIDARAEIANLPDGWEQPVTFRLTVHGASKSDD